MACVRYVTVRKLLRSTNSAMHHNRLPRQRDDVLSKGTDVKKIIWLAVAVTAIILAVLGLKWWHDNRDEFTVEAPSYPPVTNAVWLDQNWSADQRNWFHHADQGTQTFGIPYEWFLALEQPSLSLSDPGLLSDTTYLDRFGFIPDTGSGKSDLPVGFAHGGQVLDVSGAPLRNPQTNAQMTSLG